MPKRSSKENVESAEYTHCRKRGLYLAPGFLSSVNKLAMGTLSRGAELQVPLLCRTEGTGMGSTYDIRSGAETALIFIGL